MSRPNLEGFRFQKIYLPVRPISAQFVPCRPDCTGWRYSQNRSTESADMKSPNMNPSCQRLALPLLAATALFGLPAANASSYPDTVKADNPIAYYRFEDPANSSTVIDSSTSGTNPGTLNYDDYLAWPQLGQPGLGSNSVAFHLYTDGSGVAERSYVSVPYSPDLNPAGSFTTECWARATSWGSGNRCFLSSFQNYDAGWWFRQEAGAPTPRQTPGGFMCTTGAESTWRQATSPRMNGLTWW